VWRLVSTGSLLAMANSVKSPSAREVCNKLMSTESKNAQLALEPCGMEIMGDDQQILTLTLRCDDEILVQPGCMVWCDEGVVNDVSVGGFRNFLTRCFCMDESGFRVHWKNMSDQLQKIALTPSFPAKVVPVNLDTHSGELFFKAGAFMAATDPQLKFEIERAGRSRGSLCGNGIFGGQGFVLNKVTGDGWVFLSAAGAIFEKQLGPGETIVVERSCVVAWETTVHFSYRMAGGASMMCCGGEGLTMSTLTGPGYVVIQSMPFEKVRSIIRAGGGNASGGRSPVKALLGVLFVVIYLVLCWRWQDNLVKVYQKDGKEQ